jgi:GTPase SAR1 family protein
VPKQFIHICGASGVGKSTLMERLIENSDPRLRERFGVDGSFQAYGDSKKAKHPMYLFFAEAPTIIHDWQYFTHAWISHFGRAYPDAKHRIFLLWRPWSITHQALKSRGSTETIDDVVRAWREIVPHFQQLNDWGFNVEVVDASTEYYDPTTFTAIEDAPL